MSLQTLENFYKENGENETVDLLKKPVIITEKINAHRVYCKKEKNGNILFYTKKKTLPITVLERLLSDMYEPFIRHMILKKDKLQVGEYGFYLVNDPIDIEYSKKPMNGLLLTNIPVKSPKSYVETAIELDVSYEPPVFQGILSNEKIEMIISYIGCNNESLLKMFNNMFGKNCSALSNGEESVEGFVFDFGDNGTFKLNDFKFSKKEYPKLNTSSYELLVLEIFDFVKHQDFSTVKFTTKNDFMKRAEFAFEMFNRFVNYHETNNSLDNLLLIPPAFIFTKGRINKKYICNRKTFDIITGNKDIVMREKLEYLLRIFITVLKDIQRPRGIISETIAEENNYIILKISEYIKKSNELLDYKDFRKFANND